MSIVQGRLVSLLLKEAFGEIVEEVGSYLVKRGPCILRDVVTGTHLEKEQVKKSLCVLIQHGIVSHKTPVKKAPIYTLDVGVVLVRTQFPRWIRMARDMFGNVGGLIVTEVLQQGHTHMAQSVQYVCEHLKGADPDQDAIEKSVLQKFNSLTAGNFLVHVKSLVPEPDLALPMSTDAESNLPSSVPGEGKKRRRGESSDEEDKPQSKKRRKELEEDKILWRVNFDCFQQLLRNQAIVCGVSQQLDPVAASVIKTMLTLSCSSANPTTMKTGNTRDIFTHEIADALDRPKLSRNELEQYLRVLTDQQPCFLKRSEESGGGAYSINLKTSSEILCRAAIECVVRERFGSKAFRVFRLLLLKNMLEQKQVSDMAMVPSKEAKEILYTLMAENFVTLQGIPKTDDYAPSRTFYLFSVQLLAVAIMVRERCYKAMGNLITKVAAENHDNSRLLERSQQQERQLAEAEKGMAMREDEVEEILTPDEKEKVAAIKRSLDKLEHAELQLEQSITILDNYITLHTHSK